MRHRYACLKLVIVCVLETCYCFCVLHLLKLAFVTKLQSLNESHIPNVLLERLVTDTREFPPVCPIIGGILGQVRYLSIFFIIDKEMFMCQNKIIVKMLVTTY